MVAERAHRNVGERPRPDPRGLRECAERVVSRSIAREIEVPLSDEGGHAPDGLGPGARHPERVRWQLGDLLRRREQVGDRSVGSLERGACSRDEPAQRRSRPGDGYLLSVDRADDELEAVEGAGDTDPWEPSDERCELWIRGQTFVDRHWVGIEIEGPSGSPAEMLQIG